MKFIDYLNEEYSCRGNDFEIFINPTAQELKGLGEVSEYDPGYVRFIADKETQSLFVASSECIHPDMFMILRRHKQIKTKGSWFNNRSTDKWFMGIGKVQGNKIKIENKSFDFNTPNNVLKDFAWASTYFTNFKQFATNIQEEYVARGKAMFGQNNNGFEIFVNPTTKELQSLPPDIRFLADFDEKKLYVWDADYIHVEGLTVLKDELNKSFGDFGLVCTGEATKNGNKLRFINSDAAGFLYNKPWTVVDDKWLNKWFNKPFTKTYLDEYKKRRRQ